VTANVGTRMAGRYVGQSVTRKEDRRLITGHGLYVDDVTMPGLLHAAFLRSDVAKGEINGLAMQAAREPPGVVAIYTWQDFEGMFGPAWHAMLGEEIGMGSLEVPPPLAIGDVRFVGDPIAIVVADNRYVAEDALELIEVDIEAQRACVDFTAAASDCESIVHRASGQTSNTMLETPFTALSPGFEEAFSGAAHISECVVSQNRYIAVPMETRGIVASYDRGRDELELVAANQSVHGTREFFARYLGLPQASIRVMARDVGGGFGQKMFVYREECAVVLASRKLGRPVKWIEDRRENLIAAPHSRNESAQIRIAFNQDHTMRAISMEHVADVGAYPPCPSVVDPLMVPGPYKIGDFGFSMSMVWTNTSGKGAYRGPWMFESTAREMAIDHAARELDVDPVTIRRANLLSREDLPYTSPTGNVFKDITPRETFEQALEMLDLPAFREAQKQARSEGRLLGLGCCVYIEPTSKAHPTMASEGATVRIEGDGKVMAYLGTTAHGQSIETTMAQIVAETLGVDYDDVTVVQGETPSTPFGGGTGGSRTAVISGGAARGATLAVRSKLLAIAAHYMEAAPEDLDVEAGSVFVKGTPTRSISVADVAKIVHRSAELLPADLEPSLEATIRFKPTEFPTWSNATHLCVVEIDRDTCIPRVLRFIVSEDCGPMINPTVVDGQISGGVVQGLGGVLLENFVYDEDGNPLTTSFVDYLLPTTTEVPEIEIGHIPTDAQTNPGGFKGMGEGGAIGSHAAVANAIGDALAHLGVDVTSTPLGPNEIHRLLVGAGAD
jgi:aerobic carbon-monoxide dehydrogenase large subunit